MRTVLLVSEDDALGARLLRVLSDCSIFPSRTDDDALRTLRLTEVDLILKQVASPSGDLESFIAKARQHGMQFRQPANACAECPEKPSMKIGARRDFSLAGESPARRSATGFAR